MPRSLAAVMLTSLLVGLPTSAMAQRRYCPPCNPSPRQYSPPTDLPSDQPTPSREEPAPAPSLDGSAAPQAPSDTPSDFDQVTPDQAQPTFTPSTSSQPTTAATSAQSATPNSIGDFFGTSGSQFEILGSHYFAPNAAAAGGNVGRQKFGENVSPIPRDRVFVNYSYFNSTPLTAGGTDVNRFTPGFEKTFQNGNLSFELRAPFASTADSTFLSDGRRHTSQFEWGDLVFFLKGLLYNDCNVAIAGGVGFSFPTHDPFVVLDATSGTPIIKVDNNAIHALPYIAALWTPNDQLFVQTYAQIDTDLNGNEVYVDNGGGAVNAGRIQDQTYLFLDVVAGYWVYQNPCGNVRGIAPVVEFHFNRSLNDADRVLYGGTGVLGGEDDLSLLNAVVGVNLFLKDNLQIQAGYGFPISGTDEQFDGEARVSLNWLFGNGGGRRYRR